MRRLCRSQPHGPTECQNANIRQSVSRRPKNPLKPARPGGLAIRVRDSASSDEEPACSRLTQGRTCQTRTAQSHGDRVIGPAFDAVPRYFCHFVILSGPGSLGILVPSPHPEYCHFVISSGCQPDSHIRKSRHDRAAGARNVGFCGGSRDSSGLSRL